VAWDGYFEYAGTEIINVARAERYARDTQWFRPSFENDSLAVLLGDTYNSPMQDDAPWTDPANLDSYSFFGVYPLEITGVDDSTRTSTPVESTLDGGIAGRIRHQTKTVVFNVALMAASEAGVQYGYDWLKQALLGGACSVRGSNICAGSDLCFLSSSPVVDPYYPIEHIEDCLTPYLRGLRRVVFNSGPTITAKRDMSDGGAVWTATFTCVAGDPWVFGAEDPVLAGMFETADPWVGGAPEGAVLNTTGLLYNEVDCLPPTYQPVADPLCPAVILPPAPPSITLSCATIPRTWTRRLFTIPKERVPLWGEVSPTLTVRTPVDDDVRNLRVRFYVDQFGDGVLNDDPCGYCGDIVISYIPAASTLVLDASSEQVYVESGNGLRRRADSVVFATDGTPFEWPHLSCGIGYIVTLDLPRIGATLPAGVDFSLTSRAV
jgi:hypothetical protein